MKRLGVLVTAVVLCVAVGVVSLAFAETKRVKTRVTVNFTNAGPYSQTGDVFFGEVKAKGKPCKKTRTVRLNGSTFLKDRTDVSGEYEITPGDVSPGTYTVEVKKKVLHKGDDLTIICKAATSDPVVVSN